MGCTKRICAGVSFRGVFENTADRYFILCSRFYRAEKERVEIGTHVTFHAENLNRTVHKRAYTARNTH